MRTSIGPKVSTESVGEGKRERYVDNGSGVKEVRNVSGSPSELVDIRRNNIAERIRTWRETVPFHEI